MSKVKEMLVDVEIILSNVRGWVDGSQYDGDTSDLFNNCNYVYATYHELLENYYENNGAKVKDPCSDNDAYYLWEYDSISNTYYPKKEITEIIRGLMFDAMLKGKLK